MKVGIDIVEIDQVRTIDNLERFLDRYFNIEELKYIKTKSKKEQTIAGIFAAKEAFLKALEIGIGSKISLKEIIIAHSENSGAPYIVMTDLIKNVINSYGFNKINISISHGGSYSVAICNLE